MKPLFKYSLFAITALLAAALAFSCQPKEQPDVRPAIKVIPDDSPMTFGATNQIGLFAEQKYDTLATSSSRDTSDYYVAGSTTSQGFSRPMNVAVQIIADSTSGSTGANCYLQTSLHGSGDYWVDVPSATAIIDGVKTRTAISAAVLGGRVRCRCFTPTSTQNTKVRMIAYSTEDNP